MKNIPCKKCKKCGLYHDFTKSVCSCGEDISRISSEWVDIDLLSEQEDKEGKQIIGKINEDITIFVQKCPACGSESYTDTKENRVLVCLRCNKKRIADVDPIPYKQAVDPMTTDEIQGQERSVNKIAAEVKVPASVVPQTADNNDDDEDMDSESAFWLNLGGSTQAATGQGEVKIGKTANSNDSHDPQHEINGINTNDDDDDDDDDDADTGVWSILNTSPKPVVSQPKKDITLTAINYGNHIFSIEAIENEMHLLGRSAEQSDFLENDGRVGNEHCYLYFKEGMWYVKDNHSRNGTFVNEQYIGKNGERKLSSGDVLKLGHEVDSLAFKITISL